MQQIVDGGRAAKAALASNTRQLKQGSNLLFYSDNLDCIKSLARDGVENSVDLIYIDPPFSSGERYFHRVGNENTIAFEDLLRTNEYLGMLHARILQIHSLLSVKGSIFIHLDWHAVHYVKVMLDRIFGSNNFRNEIIVKRGRRKNLQYQFASIDKMHVGYDSLLWYSKSAETKFSPPLVKNNTDSKWMGFWSNINRPTMRYEIFGYIPERGQWKWSKARALDAIKNFKLYEKNFSSRLSLEQYWELGSRSQEFIRKRKGVKYPEYWIPPKTHRILDNVWMDVEAYSYTTGYGTQKHEELLERIISQFSKPGDMVADFFCGSGTTLAVAERLGRKWIGCDSSAQAIAVTRKRLGQADYSLVRI